jgi:hypothetical protein
MKPEIQFTPCQATLFRQQDAIHVPFTPPGTAFFFNNAAYLRRQSFPIIVSTSTPAAQRSRRLSDMQIIDDISRYNQAMGATERSDKQLVSYPCGHMRKVTERVRGWNYCVSCKRFFPAVDVHTRKEAK